MESFPALSRAVLIFPIRSSIALDIAPDAIPEPTYPWDVSLAVGTAMEARIAAISGPSWNQTSRREIRSVATARRDYNAEVGALNGRIRQFPANLVAGFAGVERRVPFEATEGAETPPTVSFE